MLAPFTLLIPFYFIPGTPQVHIPLRWPLFHRRFYTNPMYSFVEPGYFHVLPRCDGAPSPAYIQLFLNVSVNCVEVKGPIRMFVADSAGRYTPR